MRSSAVPVWATTSKPCVLEQARDALAKEDGVLGDDYPHGISARIRVPRPGGLSTAEAPVERLDAVDEASEARALAGIRAADAVVGDLDDRVSVHGDAMLTATEDASAYLATFASASETT